MLKAKDSTMMAPTRREFLNLTASSLAWLAAGSPLWSPRHAFAEDGLTEYLMLCSTDVPPTDDSPVKVSRPGSVKGLNVKTGEDFTIDIPFFGHMVTQNPVRPHQVITLEKWARQAALLDLNTKSVTTLTEATEDRVFSGHASFTPDGSLVVVTEDNYAHNSGKLVVRNASDLSIVRKMESYGARPHQCLLMDDNKTMFVINNGLGNDLANIAWIDLNTGALLKKIDLMTAERRARFSSEEYGHFDVSYDGWICCVGSSARDDAEGRKRTEQLPAIAFVSPQGQVYYGNFPSAQKGRVLNVTVLGQTGFAACTVDYGNNLLIFDYKTQQLAKQIPVKNVRGVLPFIDAATKDHDLILSTDDALFTVDFLPKDPAHVSRLHKSWHGTGAHISRIFV